MSVFEALRGIALQLFEVRVHLCIVTGEMKRSEDDMTDLCASGVCTGYDHEQPEGDCSAPYIYNFLTGDLRPAPDRCPGTPSIICGEHRGEPNDNGWEPCMCCPNKGGMA